MILFFVALSGLLQVPPPMPEHRHTRYEVVLLDESGAPLPNTDIALTDTEFAGCFPPIHILLRTDKRARFYLPATCSYDRLRLHAVGYDNSVTRLSLHCAGDGTTVTLRFRLRPLAVISGTLMAADGRTPRAGIPVTAWTTTSEYDAGDKMTLYQFRDNAIAPRYTEGKWEWPKAVTDSQGRFAIPVMTDLPISLCTPSGELRGGKNALRVRPGERRFIRVVDTGLEQP
jgi:hypothetical protein